MIDQPSQSPPDGSAPDQPTPYDFKKEQGKLDTLIAQFREEVTLTKTRREVRQNKRNVEEERAAHRILADETIIPDRTIDLNIRRGSAQYIQYITKSKRLLIITDNDDPSRTMESLELWFTRGMRYPKWKFPWFKQVDSMQLHGGNAMEVVFDPTKPFNVGVEFIPRDKLIMPRKAHDLQSCPHLLRQYDVTVVQLEEFTTLYGFNKAAVDAIKKLYSDQSIFRKIYRVLCKRDGTVTNYWYSQDFTSGYLRDPAPHDIGLKSFEATPEFIQAALSPDWNIRRLIPNPSQPDQPSNELVAPPLPLKEYPIFWFPFSITECEEILEEQGRASLDIHIQEALTHLLTNTVNSTTRASTLYASAENEPGQDAGMRELGTIKPGVILPRKVNYFSPPWPSAIILSVMQAMDVRKANESGNTDFAAIARQDANKTATEISSATQQAQEQSGVKTEGFSSPYLDTYGLAFLVARHQSIFLLCPRPHDPTLLFGNFNLQPAGDIEIIKRGEDRENAKEFFNIIRGTPAADKLLIFLLQHFFPDQADEWVKALEAGNKDAMIQTLLTLVQAIPRDDLTPDQSAQLDNVISAAQGMVAQSSDAGVPLNAGAPQGGAA